MSASETQNAKAIAFLSQHKAPKILVLPNAWDVASARVFEEAGFPSLATTSAGIAFTLGYPDGQKILQEEMLARIARITRAVSVPVTADVEAGYGSRPEDAGHTASLVIEAGAVGMNLEDGAIDSADPLVDLSLQLEKIHAVGEAATKAGVPLVLNARTDVYLAQVGAPETRYDETVRRLSAYRDAGADCVFVPGVTDRDTIARLAKDLGCPLNILVGPGVPPIPELEQLGVARASLGSSAMRATMGVTRKIAQELQTSGTYHALEGGIPYGEMNALFRK
ncbi:MAG: isocitrate lyase/phosphoenolpyruvate mutase family protein [Acidobacteria bacterium]|nr:isocitrate lyase/phosphoenolpyruvate mutase family protein [Acidobacteriota bacterium]